MDSWQPVSTVTRRLHHTIWEVRLAEVQVVTGPGGIVLGAQRELHALNVLFEVVEGTKDVLHSLHAHGINAVVGHCLVSLHISVPPGLSASLLDGQRLDDVTRWTLKHHSKRPGKCFRTGRAYGDNLLQQIILIIS